MAPGARSKFGAPCSKLRSFGSIFSTLKEVFVTLLGLLGTLTMLAAFRTVVFNLVVVCLISRGRESF